MFVEKKLFDLLKKNYTLYFGVAPQEIAAPYVVVNSNDAATADTFTCYAETVHELQLDFYDQSAVEAKRTGLEAFELLKELRPTSVNAQILRDDETELFYYSLRFNLIY